MKTQSERRHEIEQDPGRGGCGIVALAQLDGVASHSLIQRALTSICCMEHRGGSLGKTGDGAGLLIGIDRDFFLPHVAPGRHLDGDEPLAVGTVWFQVGERNIREIERDVDSILRTRGLQPLGWREVPVDPAAVGDRARIDAPVMRQILVGRGHLAADALDSALRDARGAVEAELAGQVALPSLSQRTVVYKALATAAQLPNFYADLRNPALKTSFVLGHRRFATNTFSNWHLVQPFRLLAHNGEINTISANTRSVRDLARRRRGGVPILMRYGSDSAQLDRSVDLLLQLGARDLPESMRLAVPPAWVEEVSDPDQRRWFEHARKALGSLGAWEGPAALVATDGQHLVAQLDRMGLRPLRWVLTHERELVVASEFGAVAIEPSSIAQDGQLEPGGTLVVDLEAGLLVQPEMAGQWFVERHGAAAPSSTAVGFVSLPSQEELDALEVPVHVLNAFGWTRQRVQRLRDMVKLGKEPVHSMGNDRPLAVFSRNGSRLYSFLNQVIAVVTNPAVDPLREGAAMDTSVYLGSSPDLDARAPDAQVKLPHPVLSNEGFGALESGHFSELKTHTLDATFVSRDATALDERLHALAQEAEDAVRAGANLLFISDRAVLHGDGLAVPAPLAVGFIHRRLARAGCRRPCSLVVSTGAVHESHDIAVLLAYGAAAVNPWAMFAQANKVSRVEPSIARSNLTRALVGGVRQIMSKMGITTSAGYQGSALFEAIGLSPDIVDYYLPDTPTRVGGLSMADVYEDIVLRARGGQGPLAQNQNVSIYRKEVTRALQEVARQGNEHGAYDKFVDFLENTPPVYLRDLLRFTDGAAIPLYEVSGAREIARGTLRGAAMSHGAIHSTAHRAIAAALNQLGSASNSGEGGEDPRRNPGREWAMDRNRIRQVASGRFGVDAEYLMGADELEIKIGQGAKPGEGGHLPGHKVTVEIASIRRTQPGVALISPPPHHDIYSIEDLAQLIRNLRSVNPQARIGVKTPSVTNLGTIAVGVAKAGADIISISGFEGGTGAAASGSILHAGLPLELGLTDAHQYLVANGIRHWVRLRADGGIKRGFDVAMALALGADEVALGTPLMVAENCVFCRGCQGGKCPVGLATQDEKRRDKYFMVANRDHIGAGTEDDQRYIEAREGVTRYLLCVAEDVRAILSRLGLRHPRELVGRTDLLRQIKTGEPRWDNLDLSELLLDMTPASPPTTAPSPRPAMRPVDVALLEVAAPVLQSDALLAHLEHGITTADQAVGARLAGVIAEVGGLESSARIELLARGCAGQAFGFAATSGMHLRLEGYANDTVGAAMSGTARIVVVAPERRGGSAAPHLAGNTVGYGATGGTLYVAGRTGQRFGVRNSGATMVCEGVGKYAFEYMTGGTGVVLGTCGPCIGSGMTGGSLFLLDRDGEAAKQLHSDVEAVFMDGARLAALRRLIEDFASATSSPRVASILDEWDEVAPNFIAVEPVGPRPSPLAARPPQPVDAAQLGANREPRAPETSGAAF
ncbi:MAG TPA: glutamate synthase large subunit [Deltaproteobacteria bacterium]|nr:glutamate synthase large subunit [Deltaproteobacteria bacterium]HCP44524.1 glutamate synthase large subunit [Deltaproteobacteria bacterium]